MTTGNRQGGNFPRLAFTLIELLGAIAIIAVLGALLLPSLQSVRLHALQAKDASNLRQVGTAILNYAGEHEEQLPGPTWLCQTATYAGANASAAGVSSVNLAFFVAPYLNCPVPPSSSSTNQICPPLINAGLKAVKPVATETLVNYLANYGTTNIPSSHQLFGYGSAPSAIPPQRLPTFPRPRRSPRSGPCATWTSNARRDPSLHPAGIPAFP